MSGFNVVFQSRQLQFRLFNLNDAPLIYQLNLDPEVTRFVNEPITTPTVAEEVLKQIILPQYAQNQYGRWAVHLIANNAFIGWCGLRKTNHHKFPDLGFRYLKKYWGQGLATEAAQQTIHYAFNSLLLPGISASAHIENTASIRVLEKCKMKLVGERIIDKTPVKTFELINPSFSD